MRARGGCDDGSGSDGGCEWDTEERRLSGSDGGCEWVLGGAADLPQERAHARPQVEVAAWAAERGGRGGYHEQGKMEQGACISRREWHEMSWIIAQKPSSRHGPGGAKRHAGISTTSATIVAIPMLPVTQLRAASHGASFFSSGLAAVELQ